MKVTIRQIAKEAKVSTATVSRVLNTPKLVKEANRKKIQAIITKYQYSYSSPIPHAQKYIGIIIPEISNIYFGNIIDSFLEKFYQFNGTHEILFYYSKDNPEKELQGLYFFLFQKCDIIIIIPTTKPILNPEIWNNLTIPVIWLERYWDSINVTLGILSNKESAAYDATISLIQNGCKSILLINGPEKLSTAQDRTKGLIKAIHEYNLSIKAQKISYGSFSWEHGYTSIKNENILDFDGIIAGSGTIAQGVLQSLYEKNISIPQKISFISFDETAVFHPTNISSVFFSGEEMAVELMQLINKIINNKIYNYIYYLNAHKILRGSEKKQ